MPPWRSPNAASIWSGKYPHEMIERSTSCRARCSKVYARRGRSTSGSMSLRVRSVSGRSLVPCPPTRITAGRLTSGPPPPACGHAGEIWVPSRPPAEGERLSYRATDAFVDEAEGLQRLGIEEVAAVDDDIAAHPPRRLRPVELADLGPLGDDDDAVRAVQRREGGIRNLDPVQMGGPVGDRVPGRDLRALRAQPPGEDEARRLAHVVRAGLESEAQQCDPLAAERADTPLELADHAPLLQLVDLDHGVQELEVVARVRRELLQRERVLREAGASVADAGPEEGRADSPIEADSLRDGRHVRARRLADVGDLVDERDARDEGSVRRELDHLRRRDVGAHDRGIDALVQLRDHISVGKVERTYDDAIGLQEVAYRSPLCGELRVRDVADVVQTTIVEPVPHLATRPDGDG